MAVNKAVYIPPYMPHTPWFPQWLHRLAPMGRRAADVLTHVRQCTLSQIEARFGALLTPVTLRPPPDHHPRRERPYSPRRTFWCFLWQMFNENTSCREVVRQLQAVLALQGIWNLDPDNSGYCQARVRLPVQLLEQALEDTAQAAEGQAPERRLLQGRVLKASDGSTVTLADTPKNQKKHPQQKGQQRGCGFPILRLSVVFSLQSGAVLQVAKGNYYQHELRLFHTLQDQFQAGDILVYDRAGGNYVVAAALGQQNVDLISRVLNRRIDWRWGKPRCPATALMHVRFKLVSQFWPGAPPVGRQRRLEYWLGRDSVGARVFLILPGLVAVPYPKGIWHLAPCGVKCCF